MQYFTEEFRQFFIELEKNNNKEWFHANKKRYEEFVKKPMLNFVVDVVAALKKRDDELNVEPKKCIGRINRDIRFSKDKTPYKIRTFGHITKGEKSDPLPVIAFQMGAWDLGIMSGFYNPGKDRLKRIREKIKTDPETFKKLYSDKNFTSTFEGIKGDANKRLPAEFKSAFEMEPLIANKQFYYVKEYSSDLVLRDDLLPLLIEHWQAAQPLNEFLSY